MRQLCRQNFDPAFSSTANIDYAIGIPLTHLGHNDPVLPSIQNYVVLDISRRDVTTGDQIDLFYPRQAPVDGRELALPEVWIARAVVLRVTPFGATAMITKQEQPKIDEGTAARVAAKMP